MRITVRVEDIEISIDDSDKSAVIMHDNYNKEVVKAIKVVCEEALKLLKERNA